MHIVIITHSFPTLKNPIGGNFIPDFAKRLIKEKCKITILIPGKTNDPPCKNNLNVKVYFWMHTSKTIGEFKIWNISDIYRLLQLLVKGYTWLKKIHLKEKIDFIFVPWILPQGISAYFFKFKFSIPYGTWALGTDINKFYPTVWGKYLLSKILKRADINFANSFNLCSKVEKLSSKECKFLGSVKLLKMNSIKKIKKKNRKFIYMFIGRLEKIKGVDILIEAAIKLFKQIKEDLLFVIGDGKLKNILQKKVKLNNMEKRIIFTGIIPYNKIPKYLSLADCLILPSRNESMPNSFWEALQIGIRVIGTDVGDLGKRIKEFNAGIVIPKESLNELYQAMLKIKKFTPVQKISKKKLPLAERSAIQFLKEIKTSLKK